MHDVIKFYYYILFKVKITLFADNFHTKMQITKIFCTIKYLIYIINEIYKRIFKKKFKSFNSKKIHKVKCQFD